MSWRSGRSSARSHSRCIRTSGSRDTGSTCGADALDAAPDGGTRLPAAIAAAEKAVVDTRDLQSRRGRASWLQERSIGLQDPGATAMWRFLQCWQTAAASTKVAS
ncbi:DAK2 domain-containing protein [Cellulomonas shaoxiangyii]|uniref:DAK2 domain-containing protein n=1 Tax=Cellulomonas shaoxiangyii TaxID=2566013 RepID=A0A4V1CMA5_9CELL|nr:DAK2 domain-containing protein [Cellulomonas shaoxiangyii]QCB92265.1 DAK2 domain-containing protein [Cellulomonas shaoxiangyii]TGY85923.1 DAK2 domain-containing protein [Cellulomonas shaoxiangyii]